MPHELSFNLQNLSHGYANGITPADVVRESFRRIEDLDDPGVFLTLRAEADVLKEAQALGDKPVKNTPLWGLPFVIKDNIDAGGIPTTAGCPAFAYTPLEDAFVVARLRKAGALLIGKTNMDQFATGLVGTRTPHDVPQNAIDAKLIPGGSSSGSAVAVAHGLVSFSLGTDTAGSGRVPAALNGIVGLKPSLGALSNSGIVPACRTLDCISIFALTPSDAFHIFKVAIAHDENDLYSKAFPKPHRGPVPARLRIGIPDVASRPFFGDEFQAQSYQSSLEALENLGAEFEELDFRPFYAVAEQLYDGPWVAERYAVIEELLNSQPEAVHPVTRQVTELAKRFSATDTFRAMYLLRELTSAITQQINTLDMLCVPSVPRLFTRHEVDEDPIGTNARLGTYTNFVNLLNLCAIAVPVSQRGDSLPGSITLIGRSGTEGGLVSVAEALQQKTTATLGATTWPLPTPEAPSDALQSNETAIVAVGAHMSGLPLNSELTKRGARLLRMAQTAPIYRLYKLPGDPPIRPGLVRKSDGASIDVEVWSLPFDEVGPFLADIPSPLGLGTVLMEDGTSMPGFLCESIATEKAEDITHFGGWRAFLSFQSTQTRNEQGE